MSDELQRMQQPGATAPAVSNLVAHCQVCGTQWQVKESTANARGCSFCDAPASAIRLLSEAPRTSGLVTFA